MKGAVWSLWWDGWDDGSLGFVPERMESMGAFVALTGLLLLRLAYSSPR